MEATPTWRMASGGPSAQGRIGARWLLVAMLLVVIPRNAVDADSCPTGCGGIMSPHHLGGQVAREAVNRRREWLLVRGAPSLFRVGPPSRGRMSRYPAATQGAQESVAGSPSNVPTQWAKDSMASTAWPATWHGSGLGMSISMGTPRSLGAQGREEYPGTMKKTKMTMTGKMMLPATQPCL